MEAIKMIKIFIYQFKKSKPKSKDQIKSLKKNIQSYEIQKWILWFFIQSVITKINKKIIYSALQFTI